MPNFSKVRCAIFVSATLLSSCERRGIEVYSVAKDLPQAGAPGSTAAAVRLPNVAPQNWEALEIPGNSPRVASFRVAAEEPDAEPADMAVTIFPGDVGGLLANVNRWRGEMEQDPITAAELEDATGRLERDDHTIHIVDTASEDRRTLGAILPVTGETYFFKLTGPKAVVTANRDGYFDYLDRVEILAGAHAHNHTHDHEPSPEELEPQPERPKIEYETPENWVEGDPTSMRVASFSVTDEAGREADISVIPLGTTGGARLAIVNQWRATLRLDNATEEQLPDLIEKVEIGGRGFELVDFESDEAMLDDDRKARIVVAYGVVGEDTWYFKVAGDSELVAEQKPVLLDFLKTVKFDAP